MIRRGLKKPGTCGIGMLCSRDGATCTSGEQCCYKPNRGGKCVWTCGPNEDCVCDGAQGIYICTVDFCYVDPSVCP